jgi:outer membrane receptor protein involved in Fe transport
VAGLSVSALGTEAGAAPETGQGPLEEIVVTATRREASVDSIPEAVTAIPRAAIAREQLAIEALADTVGGYVQQTTPGQGAAIIRGLKGSAVLHLVDGMRLNNAIFRSAPTQYFALVPGAAAERIEVVRGTLASLYGSDAVGGVVQLVTRRPAFEGESASATGEVYADVESADESRRIGATLDAGTRRWYTTLSGELLKTGDRTIGGGTTVAPSGFESRAFRAAAGLTPDDDTRWHVDLHYSEQPRTPRVDELVPGFGETEPASSEFFFAPNRRIYGNARHERERGIGGLDWVVSLAWQRVDDDRVTRDLDAPERVYEQNRSDLWGLLTTAGKSGDRSSWLAGVELYYDAVSSARQGEAIATGELTSLTPRFPDGSEVLQGSLFLNGSLEATERTTLSGGLRFSEVEVRLAETPFTPAETVRTGDFAGDLGLILRFAEHWQWIANAGAGFRAPNVFDLGTLGNRPGNRFNIPNTALDSEHVVQLDTGLRYHDERFQFEAVVYSLRYDDRITSVDTGELTPSGRDIVQSVNAARSDIVGLEAGAVAALSDALTLQVVLNYTRGEQRIEGAGLQTAEEPADRIPPLGGRLELSYDSGRAWQASAWLRYADAQDRLSASDVADTRIDPAGTAGWGMLGGRLTWLPDENWSLSVGVDNLLDKRYRVHGSGIDAPGRNVTLGVRRRF